MAFETYITHKHPQCDTMVAAASEGRNGNGVWWLRIFQSI